MRRKHFFGQVGNNCDTFRGVARGVDRGGQSTPLFAQTTYEIRVNPMSFLVGVRSVGVRLLEIDFLAVTVSVNTAKSNWTVISSIKSVL